MMVCIASPEGAGLVLGEIEGASLSTGALGEGSSSPALAEELGEAASAPMDGLGEIEGAADSAGALGEGPPSSAGWLMPGSIPSANTGAGSAMVSMQSASNTLAQRFMVFMFPIPPVVACSF